MLEKIADVEGRIANRGRGEGMSSGARKGRVHNFYFLLLFTFGVTPRCYIPVKNGWIGKKLNGLAASGGGERGGSSTG